MPALVVVNKPTGEFGAQAHPDFSVPSFPVIETGEANVRLSLSSETQDK